TTAAGIGQGPRSRFGGFPYLFQSIPVTFLSFVDTYYESLRFQEDRGFLLDPCGLFEEVLWQRSLFQESNLQTRSLLRRGGIRHCSSHYSWGWRYSEHSFSDTLARVRECYSSTRRSCRSTSRSWQWSGDSSFGYGKAAFVGLERR